MLNDFANPTENCFDKKSIPLQRVDIQPCKGIVDYMVIEDRRSLHFGFMQFAAIVVIC